MLGGMFLDRYVTVLDFDNARLGFAESAQTIATFDTTHVAAVQFPARPHKDSEKSQIWQTVAAGKRHSQVQSQTQAAGANVGMIGIVVVGCIAVLSIIYFKRADFTKASNYDEEAPSNNLANDNTNRNSASGYKEDRHLLRSDTNSTVDMEAAYLQAQE